ncbi:hypothetical protein ES319_A05G292500v1 [Gossypium barbadense]|uniref:Uncharacterized protein n=3 Tax=Gossypium TaxID=3633 RepID=A0A5J5VUJ2_GOSBA|nr:hypothetical protein ES319_A05G292500v1 [Gossypium barbadense]TYH18837.1 hypothetical protein ES288_A05G305300v1 [Gossypium darwinii]TYI29332.1 hypothetical protein ES332_A05G309000v1 [Gossypium tomentosum]
MMTLVPNQTVLYRHRLHRIRESPSTIRCRKPIAHAKSNTLSHALASATKASTTSSKR